MPAGYFNGFMFLIQPKNAVHPKYSFSMKRKARLLRFQHLLLVFLLLAPVLSRGQVIDSFPRDSAEYIQTLNDYLENRISDEQAQNLEAFVSEWETGQYKPAKRDSIVRISNALLQQNANRQPHFTTMIRLMRTMQGTRFDSLHFETWMKGFNHLFHQGAHQIKEIDEYFEFTLGFIQSRGLYLSRIRNWYAPSRDYRFTYDTTLKIIYPQTLLKCRHRDDSIQIHQTSGTYYPFRRHWEGHGGEVTWQRVGYSRNQMRAQLNGYEIDLTRAEYKADSVKYINNLYFDQPVRGQLHDKLQSVRKTKDATYPLFRSYKKIFQISNIYENMDYKGGFKMMGAQFRGSGGKGQEATLKIHRHGEDFMTVRSQIFMFDQKQALSRKAEVTIHLKNDSIYHTGLSFHYDVSRQEIELLPNDNILSKSVYYNTYHQVSMNFDRLLWNTKKDKIYFTHSRNASMGQATFTSMNYFTLERWRQIGMRDRVHPLIAIRNYHNKVDHRKFDAGAFASYLRLPPFQVRQRLMYLAQDGFIFYDLEADTVTINDKLFDYIQSRIGKIDYDVLRINSSTTSASEHNAILNLSSMKMHINGVGKTFVSDSQNVVLYPDHQGITMKKNRNFTFDGVVEAGLFTFFGDSLSFDYRDFTIHMKQIDSLQLKYQTDEKNQFGQKILAHVENTVSDLKGILHIDHPNNKSGKMKFPKYPYFEAKEKSYVYYDHLFNGPYKRKNFYFELYPFTMDSLDNFNPASMKFAGNFHSADIFPPFEDTLELRPDNSLGFTKTTSDKGMPLYEGKGTYHRQIDMSNQGLRGQGRLNYLTAQARTDSVLFFPDSTSVHTNGFHIAQKTTGIEYPRVKTKKSRIKWYPHRDNMHIWQAAQPFSMYGGKSNMEGYLNLSPTGLTGKGMMDMKKATLESDHFAWEAHSFDADTANFRLRTLNRNAVAFRADTLNAHVDYNYGTARFSSVGRFTRTAFPQNLYQAYLDAFVWQMEQDRLEMESTPETTTGGVLDSLKEADYDGALFLSTHKGQDSLRFTSPKAIFRLADTSLITKEVQYMNVADARIFPDQQTLRIRKQARMDTLRNAELIAGDTSQMSHTIFDAQLKVNSRYDYQGSGNYRYKSPQQPEQIVHFSQIGVNDSLHTTAQGQIARKDSFQLSPYFRYAGEVHLNATRRLLHFSGNARIRHQCSPISPRYVQFESVINPANVTIPVARKNNDPKGNKLFTGSYLTIDSTHVYSSFLTPRKDPSDDQIIGAHGRVDFNPNQQAYEIAPRARLNGNDSLSPLIRLQRKSCSYLAQGKMNPGVDYGKLTIQPTGNLKHDLAKNKVSMNVTMPVDFLFSSGALDSMARDLNNRSNLPSYQPQSETYRENLYRIAGHQAANQYFKTTTAHDSLAAADKPIPEPLRQTLLFSNLRFRWNTETNSFIARDNIKLALINGQPVHKKMDGFIEIVKQKFGDKLYIYLTPDENTHYFFYYFRGMMRTTSSNQKFIHAIKEVPKRKRNINEGLMNTVYQYILSTKSSFSKFRRHMKKVNKTLDSEK